MAQTNYTPISLYYSTTASAVPTAANLVPGELAINTNDGKLYYEDSSGVVRVLATKSTGTIGGSTTQVQYNSSGSLAGSANLTFDGTNLTTGGSETASRFIPTGSTVATNGMYLPAANTLGFSTNSTERMRIDSSGNLGLGVTPSAWSAFKALQLPNGVHLASYTSGVNIMDMGTNYYFNGSDYIYTNTDYAERYEQRSGQHRWYNAASGTAGNAITFTQAMTLDSSGYFYVNTTTNFNTNSIANFQAKASEQGPTFASQTSGNYSAICWNSGTATTSLLAFQSGSGQAGVGSITYNGSLVLYNTTSDQRLKTNIINAPSALSKINSIQIRSFDWIETGNHIDFGVIAQELEQVAPETVTQGEDKEDGSIKRAWAVDTSVLVPAMIKSIQEQQALIESLTTRLTALENK